MPSRMQIDYDVNRAMFHVLVPTLIPEDEYNAGLKPSSLNIGAEPWASQLSEIFAALRRKYEQLHADDIRVNAAETYDRPLAFTRNIIVNAILQAGIWFPTG